MPSFIDAPQERTLLKAFLQSLYDPDTISQCNQFGFVPVPADVRNTSLNGIDMLDMGENSTEWTFETDTMMGIGQGDYVISKKRRAYDEVQITDLEDEVASLNSVAHEWADTVSASTDAGTVSASAYQRAAVVPLPIKTASS